MARTIESPARHPLRLRDVHDRDRETRVLFVGKSAGDVVRLAESVRRGGLQFEQGLASNLDEARAAIEEGGWTAIVADYDFGNDTALSVLRLARASAPDVPSVILVGAMYEDRVAEALRIVRREIEAADARRALAATEERQRASLGQVAATVAHEFNNVLMGIAPFVDVIRRSKAPEKVAAALDHIGTAMKRGRRITADIHRYMQPAEPVRAPVDVDARLQAVGAEARSVLGPAYPVRIESEPLWMNADAIQLHQVFMTLIQQARETMPAGGEITLSARREPKHATFAFGDVDDPSRYVHLVVSDKGRGLSEEKVRHAFEPLLSSFGLAVAQQVVLRHGGQIFVESTPGAGTTFHLFIPLANIATATMPEGAGEHPHDHVPREILLVDDDPLVSAGVALLLEVEGYAVTCVGTGRAALDAMRSSVPDAVVLDLGLPDMDGKSVFAAIAVTHPTLPVIFSTGRSDCTGLAELLVRPNVECLRKPYESRTLMDTLAKLLGTRPPC